MEIIKIWKIQVLEGFNIIEGFKIQKGLEIWKEFKIWKDLRFWRTRYEKIQDKGRKEAFKEFAGHTCFQDMLAHTAWEHLEISVYCTSRY